MSRPVKNEPKSSSRVVIRPYRKADPKSKEIEPGLMLQGARYTLAPYGNRHGVFKCDLTQEEFEKTFFFKDKVYKTLREYLIDVSLKLTTSDVVLFPDENEEHRLMMTWLKYVPEIAWDADQINPFSTKFIGYSELQKAENELTKMQLRRKAMNAVEELRIDEIRDTLQWAFGRNTYTSAEPVAKEMLFSYADSQPEKVIAAIEDKSRYTKALISKALTKNILRKKNNSIFYGDTFLGQDLDSAAAMIDAIDHQEIKIAIKKTLEANA